MNRYIVFPFVSSLALFISAAAYSSSDEETLVIEEIVVSAAFEKSQEDLALSISVVQDDELRNKAAASLGEALSEEIGISLSSYGTSVGHPVIRGQTGNRVSVLQNGATLADVANQSPDHVEAVEPLTADRVEVLRGPSTLLYGGGAVAGAINVIDGRIPEVVPEKPRLMIQQSNNSVNSGDNTAIRIDTGFDRFAFHIDGYRRKNGNVDIKGFAIDELAVAAREELFHGDDHDDDHDDDDHDDHDDDHDDDHGDEETENTFGYLNNSDGKANGGTFGFSFVGDNGFFGVSASRTEKSYGLPAGTHAHHEEEGHDDDHGDDHDDDHGDDHDDDHGDDHDDDHDDDHEEGHAEHDHGGHEGLEYVRIDMEMDRYDVRAGLNFDEGWMESLRASLAFTDYKHDEVEYFEDGDSHVGTTYANEGFEGRVSLKRRSMGSWAGVYGLQLSEAEFSAVGEEAFIPLSDISSLGVFGVERYDGGSFFAEVGFRIELGEVATGSCVSEENAFSVSGNLLYDLTESSNVGFVVSRSQRSPSVEELYSNISQVSCERDPSDESLVLHAATGLFEIGDANLASETANNIELTYRLTSELLNGEISAYHNQIDDYITLALSSETMAQWMAMDATFSGIEAKLALRLTEQENFAVTGVIFGDAVRAEFDAGGNVPRIPASKAGVRVKMFSDDWSINISATRFMEQDNVGNFEVPTDAYTAVSFNAEHSWPMAKGIYLNLFARGDNLLDEEVRHHGSFTKNYAPGAGRSIKIGFRVNY